MACAVPILGRLSIQGLKAFYGKHAPGTKPDTDLEAIAAKCAKNDEEWLRTKLNEPLKKK